jgi:nucleotide-binding universal stress UspA family protein
MTIQTTAQQPPTPQYRRILVPTDGSEGARSAAEAAAGLAQISGGQLFALHVLPPDTVDAEYLGLTGMVGAVAPLEAALAEPSPMGDDGALSAVENVGRDHGVPVSREQVVDAKPARAIAETAENLNCDLIVMSSHGYGTVFARLMGNTTAKVVAECSVPVLVVH